jgi:hypothetical protein
VHVVGEIVVIVEADPALSQRVLGQRDHPARRGGRTGRRRRWPRGGIALGRVVGSGVVDGRTPYSDRRLGTHGTTTSTGSGGRGPGVRRRDRAVIAAATAATAAGVEAISHGRGGEPFVILDLVAGIEIVEMGDDVADFGELGDVDLALADEVEHDPTELGEGVGAATGLAGIGDARATLAGGALEGIAQRADLRGGRAQERAKCAAQLGRLEASTSSLPCHARSVYRRSVVTRWLWLGAVVGLAACPPPEPVAPKSLPPVSGGKVRVRVFTEPTPVKRVGTAGRFLFVATEDALQRWDDKGAVLAMNAQTGLSGDHIVALATDVERKWMWILTDGGLGRYDAGLEVYSELLAPPAALGIDYVAIAKEGIASLAPAENGVWLGSSKGLLFVSEKGGWVTTPIKEPVHALVADRAGWLWIATKGGLVARKPSGDVLKIDDAHGCDVTVPRLLVEAPGDRVMVIGLDAQGRELLAIGKGTSWISYRTLPAYTWDAATRRGDAMYVMGAGRVYRIVASSTAGGGGGAVRPLAREGVRLVPMSGPTASEWVIDATSLVVPPGATVLGAVDDMLLIGTRDLGTARYREGDSHPRDWLRRKQMFEDATGLTVACARTHDCWLATGARHAWHWNGERFAAGGPDDVVLAVTRDPAGVIYALHRAPGEKEVHLSRIDNGTWTRIPKVSLTTPGDAPEVSFARFADDTALWIGLRYRDGVERRGYGIAIVEPASGKVAYHRTEAVPDKKKDKMLPIPVGVIDADVRGDTAWFATNEGIARLADGQVKIWTEADGLRSELARAVTIAPEGGVIVATGAGAGVWDGKGWGFPPELRFEINDVVASRNGHVWMATERGIAAWDGKKVRRVDRRRGLAEDIVLDVTIDQFDRVWVRGPGSLTLISQ